jgi:hypothetical protein
VSQIVQENRANKERRQVLRLIAEIISAAVLALPQPGASAHVVIVHGSVTVLRDHTQLAGVFVEARTESDNQPVANATTDAFGYYQLQLPAGSYTMRYELPGFQLERREHILALAAPIILDIGMRELQTAESITVTGEVPLITPTSTASRSMPPVALAPTDSLRLVLDWLAATGVAPLLPTLRTDPTIAIGRQALDTDGVPEPILATAGDADVHVLTAALPAEYSGGAAGLVLTLADPLMRNQLDATIDSNAQPAFARAAPQDLAPPSLVHDRLATAEVQATVGGPLVLDRLWTFGSYRTSKTQLTNRVAEERTQGKASVEDRSGSAKIAFQAGQLILLNRLAGTQENGKGMIGDYYSHLFGTPSSGSNELKTRDLADLLTAMYAQNTLAASGSAHINRHRETFQPQSATSARHRDIGRQLYATGGAGYVLDALNTQAWGGTGKIEFVRGDQEITFGGDWNSGADDVHSHLTGGEILDSDAEHTVERRYVDAAGATTSGRLESVKRTDAAAYVQGKLAIQDRLFTAIGARWEALRATRGGIELQTSKILPRLAATYVTADKRSQLTAAYSNYVEAFTDAELISLLPSAGLATSQDGTVAIFAPPTVMDHVRPRWSNELHASYGHQIGATFLATASLTQRDLQEDLTLSSCGQRTCVGNPGRGSLTNYPRPKRSGTTAQISIERQHTSNNLAVAYAFTHQYGNTESLAFPQTMFSVDPYLDLRRALPPSDGSLISGPLRSDRRHQLFISGKHEWEHIGVTYTAFWKTGAPTSRFGYSDLLGTYTYPLSKRGSQGRTPTVYDANLVATYTLRLTKLTIETRAAVYNLLNAQRPLLTDERWSFREADNRSPTPTNPHFGEATARTPPRTLLVGIRFTYHE